MADCNHDEVLSPELDAAVARAAMAEGDLTHAARHVAAALAGSPDRADLLALLEELAAAAGGAEPALALFPLEVPGGVWFGAAAVHARLLGASEPDRALELLCQVALTRPELPYLGWALAWQDRLDPIKAVLAFNALMGLPEEEAQRPTMRGAAELARALALRSSEPWPSVMAAILTRRAGELDLALQLAQQAFERWPSAQTGVALAGAQRALDQLEEAQKTWERVLMFAPADVGVLLDLADTLLQREDLDGALARYEQVLELQPEQPWAMASGLYVRWRQKPDVLGRLALSYFADRHPENRRARELADRVTPWLGMLPPPREAALGVLPQLQDNPRTAQGTITLTLSHLESPSSQLAFRRFLRPHGGQLELVIQQVPPPDMRVPSRHARFPLWRWTGTEAQPAMGVPTDARAHRLLDEVARWPFHAPTWLQQGAPRAAELGLGSTVVHVEQILRAALHPPPPPAGIRSWEWAHRVVHAAALVLAGMAGWSGSVHRDGLLSMAAVRNDWFAEAAAVALAERARLEPALREEVQPLLLTMLRDGPESGYWCVGWPVTCALLRLGQDQDEDLRHALVAHLQGFEDAAAPHA